MIEIIKTLMNYGMNFEYENKGSKGEQITCYMLGMKVSNQDGYIWYSISTEPRKIEETEENYKGINILVENGCIAETT